MKQIIPGRVASVLLFAASSLGGLSVVLSRLPLFGQFWMFLHYIQSSAGAQGVAGKITYWERFVYSFILAAR